MTYSKLIELANASGGTLYLMGVLLLVALTVILERSMYLSRMMQDGDKLIQLLGSSSPNQAEHLRKALDASARIPHVRLFEAAEIEAANSDRETCAGHLEEAIMREVPLLDRSIWMLDTIITLAPLMGLFGTIIGMFGAFSVLGDVQSAPQQVTGGIAEALIATAAGLLIAMIGLLFYNWLNTKIRIIVHQMEMLKVMLLNRRSGAHSSSGTRLALKAA
jgi:biopolymer transport protein ExbB